MTRTNDDIYRKTMTQYSAYGHDGGQPPSEEATNPYGLACGYPVGRGQLSYQQRHPSLPRYHHDHSHHQWFPPVLPPFPAKVAKCYITTLVPNPPPYPEATGGGHDQYHLPRRYRRSQRSYCYYEERTPPPTMEDEPDIRIRWKLDDPEYSSWISPPPLLFSPLASHKTTTIPWAKPSHVGNKEGMPASRDSSDNNTPFREHQADQPDTEEQNSQRTPKDQNNNLQSHKKQRFLEYYPPTCPTHDLVNRARDACDEASDTSMCSKEKGIGQSETPDTMSSSPSFEARHTSPQDKIGQKEAKAVPSKRSAGNTPQGDEETSSYLGVFSSQSLEFGELGASRILQKRKQEVEPERFRAASKRRGGQFTRPFTLKSSNSDLTPQRFDPVSKDYLSEPQNSAFCLPRTAGRTKENDNRGHSVFRKKGPVNQRPQKALPFDDRQWTRQEDQQLGELVNRFLVAGFKGNADGVVLPWQQIAQQCIPARTVEQCRRRWYLRLDPAAVWATQKDWHR